MGISTFTSYHGSMLLHSIGLGEKLSDQYFPSLPSYFAAWNYLILKVNFMKKSNRLVMNDKLNSLNEVGLFRFRKGGELHGFNPTDSKKYIP